MEISTNHQHLEFNHPNTRTTTNCQQIHRSHSRSWKSIRLLRIPLHPQPLHQQTRCLQTDVAYFERNGGGWESAGTPNPSPTPRSYFALGYSADRELLYIYGGYTADPAGVEVFAEVNYLGDLWKFRLTTRTWVQINPENAGPGKRDNAKMIVDDQNNLIYIYGGADWTGKVYNDLWVFNDNTDTWSLVIPDGAPGSPPPTIGVYWFIRKIRRTRLEFFIFGGSSGDGTGTLTNKMYKLSIPV